ncbi:MAG: sialidase family protein [Candidatus Hydrogenedentes bacterium]|nr:sialidase family protein [Candidatus Hydrogenedentota bacterium]
MASRIGAILGVLICASTAWAESAQLDWVERIYGDGRHNAFTDLVQWNGQYYVCFRHAESHMSLDGQIRVMRSADLHAWEPCGTIDTAGDDRDPHLSPAGDRLYVFFGTWDIVHQPGNKLLDRSSVRSYCAYTTDGSTWSKVDATYEPGWWLWRVSRNNGRQDGARQDGARQDGGLFYSAAYTAVRPTPAARETRLLQSSDGINWTLVSTVTRERNAGEADMVFEPDGSIWLISRTGDQSGGAMFSRSDPARAK